MAYHQLTQDQRYLITHNKGLGKSIREFRKGIQGDEDKNAKLEETKKEEAR